MATREQPAVGPVLFVAPLLALALLVTGCGTGVDDEPRLPQLQGSAQSASPTRTPDPVRSSLTGRRLPAEGSTHGAARNPIVAGRLAGGTRVSAEVQLVYLRFWVERARALQAADVDEKALARVAVGPARTGVLKAVRDLADLDRHAEGGSILNIRSVTITDRAAVVLDCLSDRSVIVDAAGRRIEPPDLRPQPLRATVVKTGTRRRVRAFEPAASSTCRSAAPSAQAREADDASP